MFWDKRRMSRWGYLEAVFQEKSGEVIAGIGVGP